MIVFVLIMMPKCRSDNIHPESQIVADTFFTVQPQNRSTNRFSRLYRFREVFDGILLAFVGICLRYYTEEVLSPQFQQVYS